MAKGRGAKKKPAPQKPAASSAKAAAPAPQKGAAKKSAAGIGAAKAAPSQPLAALVPAPGPIQTQVIRATLDPGYRLVAQLLDEWAEGCDCEDGSIPSSQVEAYIQSLLRLSLDPALKILAPAMGALMGNCCETVTDPQPGAMNTVIKRLTLDPGARLLASCIDGMHAHCCGED